MNRRSFIVLCGGTLALKACGGSADETVHDRLVATGLFGFHDVPHGEGTHPVIVRFRDREIPFPTHRYLAPGSVCFTIYVNDRRLQDTYLEDTPIHPDDEVTVNITGFLG